MSQRVSTKPAQVVTQSRQLSLFEALLGLQLVHLSFEPPLLLPQPLVLESLLLKLSIV
jgi:hypothetical protein